jgi:hypothetical protein
MPRRPKVIVVKTESIKEPVKETEPEPVKEKPKKKEHDTATLAENPSVVLEEPDKEPIKEPIKEPVKEPIKEPVKEPIKEPVKEKPKRKRTRATPITKKIKTALVKNKKQQEEEIFMQRMEKFMEYYEKNKKRDTAPADLETILSKNKVNFKRGPPKYKFKKEEYYSSPEKQYDGSGEEGYREEEEDRDPEDDYYEPPPSKKSFVPVNERTNPLYAMIFPQSY